MELQKIYTDLILEFSPNKVGNNKVVAIQGDVGSRCIAVKFKNGKNYYDLEEEYEYRLNVKYSDVINTYSSTDEASIFSISDDKLIIDIPWEVSLNRGISYVNINIIYDNSILTSEIFCLSVLSTIVADQDSESDDDADDSGDSSSDNNGETYELTEADYEEIAKFVDISTKQDVLTAGDNISIENNVISANVPTDVSGFTNDVGYLVADDISNKADKSDIPTKVSELENDSGYINSLDGYATESYVDDAVANKADKSDIPTVPTVVSAFTNDAGYLVADDVKDKADKSEIPTKVSELTNDAGYINSLEGYATEEWVEGKGYLTEHQDISGKQDVATLETDVKTFIDKDYIYSLIDDGDEVEY